ncbi:hypothetical protein [Ruegeria marina]|uniref:Uncharacterized protein n=1 Tax=Ruegeria marina TaxID=639004 RepID=A0A1G6QV31_9RHOB|nr:hypothetical protein [Ruegeria marina]SDC96132.1 hypothetical protein SAMN04488239_104240 [Ruegeria marina]
MAGIGHNGGPSMEPGQVWRTHAWRQAQKALMPNAIPMLVLKMRMSRAAELGMDYRTYARVRQYSGQDILGLLFSSNALRIFGSGGEIPAAESRTVSAVRNARRLALVHPPAAPEIVLTANRALEDAARAPRLTDSWSEMRARVRGLIQGQRLPGSAVLVIGDAPLEAEWVAAGRAAGYLPSAEYFRHQAG